MGGKNIESRLELNDLVQYPWGIGSLYFDFTIFGFEEVTSFFFFQHADTSHFPKLPQL